MRKLVYLLSFLFLSSLLYSQPKVTPTLSEIEEHGITKIPAPPPAGEFSVDTTQWTPLPAASSPFGRVASGVIGDYLYVFCSQGATGLAVALHLPTRTWTASTVPSALGYNAASCVANGELYKLSGTGSTNVFEKFTPTSNGLGTWTSLTPGPSNVMNAQNAIAFDGSNYIYAYSADYSTPAAAFLARYNISAGTWENLNGSPHPKRYPGFVAVDGKLYVIGGLVPAGVDPQVCQKYDPATSTWSTIAPVPEAINFAKWSTTTDGKLIYLLGSGGGYSTYPGSSNVYYYDPQSDSWYADGHTPAERGLPVGVYLTGFNRTFFGGGNAGGSGTNFQADCWEGDNPILIPVELTSFSASLNNNMVILSWETATEKNNHYFEVQRSSDNISFTTIGNVQGKGNSVVSQAYSFSDVSPLNGISYYRLKQVDFSGEFDYSAVAEVNVGDPLSFELRQNYPNPFNPSTDISYSLPAASKVSLRVFDPLGREAALLIDEFQEAGNYLATFNSHGLSSGIYFCRITAGDFVKTIKMNLLK